VASRRAGLLARTANSLRFKRLFKSPVLQKSRVSVQERGFFVSGRRQRANIVIKM
jgi:hypothetical protein